MNDYIEPLLEIQRMSKELHKLTLHKQWEAAYQAADAMLEEVDKLKNWCWNAIKADKA